MIGILCALSKELEAMRDRIENPETRHISGYDFISGSLCGKDVVLCQCGVGKVNAALCAEAMIITYGVKLVINCGVAGALREPLEIGDIVIATDLVQYDVDTSALGDPIGFVSTVNTIAFPCEEKAAGIMYDIACKVEGIRSYRYRIASGDRFVTNKEEKDRIYELFNAYACEMEGGAIAQVCLVNSVDCIVLRAISDSSSGAHQMEYNEFMPMAAENSSKVLLAFLKEYH